MRFNVKLDLRFLHVCSLGSLWCILLSVLIFRSWFSFCALILCVTDLVQESFAGEVG